MVQNIFFTFDDIHKALNYEAKKLPTFMELGTFCTHIFKTIVTKKFYD
jgi:hypothetical protein